ncbi:hypothetical protein FRB94_012330 [Tulasnella sp. JGI-2019a]|nr:hypothetical protein FRB94_012330 [Tulasnella sp. JGI-2019a]
MYSWNESLGKEVLYAMIEIPAGEEITVNYTTTLDRLKRRAELQSAWAFTCICQSCSLPPEELKKSDERIAQLSKIIDVIPILLHFNPVSAIANIRQALVIAEEERLYNQNYAQCGEAFQICAAFGDVVNAKVWAGRAADAYMRCYGADDEVNLQMRSYNEDPRRFSEWGQLGNRKLSS